MENSHDEIIGFVCVVVEENCLSQIFIDTRFQGHGIGTLLMTEAKKMCPSKLGLHTLKGNIQSRKFYGKHGFVSGEKTVNSNNGHVNIWCRWQADN